MPRTLKIDKSSNIKSAVLGDDGVLEVTFQTGQSARYRNVKEAMLDEWEKDKSAGSWFHRNIRSKPGEFPVIPGEKVAAVLGDAAKSMGIADGVATGVAPSSDPTLAGVLPKESPAPAQSPLEQLTPAEQANAMLLRDGVVVTEDNCTELVRVTAREAYDAYVTNAGGKNYEGKPCPKWEDLTPAIRGHWCAAVIAASHNLQRDLLDQVNRLRKLVPWKNRGGGRS